MNKDKSDNGIGGSGVSEGIVFIPLILHMHGGKGHVRSYHIAVEEAVSKLNWKYIAAVSKGDFDAKFPLHWKIEYVNNGILNLERDKILSAVKNFKLIEFIKSTINFSFDIRALLRSCLSKNEGRIILFLETFNPVELLSLFLSLPFFKGRKRLSIWMLLRSDITWGGNNHRLMATLFHQSYRLFFKIFTALLPKGSVILLTDSEKLKVSLEEYYGASVNVVPIPHHEKLFEVANGPRENISASSESKLICWWPGAPRPEKGVEIIKKIASMVKENSAKKFKLIVAKSLRNEITSNGIEIEYVEDYLIREKYNEILQKTNFVLLPYSEDLYSKSTSGIFAEMVIANKIPIVTKGTWMAYELEKFSLGDLVLDWDCNFYSDLLRIINSREIIIKLSVMRDYYHSYHSISKFALEINEINEINQ